MIAVERFWQGDRNQRIRLDKEPWSAEQARRKVMTHLSWLLVAAATGGAFVSISAMRPRCSGSSSPAKRRCRLTFSLDC